MSGFEEYGKHDAVSLAALVNSGEISETELLDESLSRMRAIQPKLNAITCDMEPFARAEIAAGVPDGPFRGVPFMAYKQGARAGAVDLFKGIQEVHLMGRRLAEFHKTYDLLLTPTLARRPVELGYIPMTDTDIDGYWDRLFRYIPFTPQQNLSGQPAISLPLAMSDDGLPIGIQFAARFGDEATLLRIAGQLEQAMPWSDRRPPVYSG